jgi:hypothetical protein
MFLFENPILKKQVSKNVFAYKFRNGLILIKNVYYNIEKRFYGYTMTESIKIYRKENK